MFFLPRTHKLMDPKDPTSITDEPVELMDVHNEIQNILSRERIEKSRVKKVKRNYCFGKQSEGVPQEGTYFKVKYPAKYPLLPSELSGCTFSHVFGRSTMTELLIIKRELMGPCWITITNLVKPVDSISYCKMEFTLESLKHYEKSIRVDFFNFYLVR